MTSSVQSTAASTPAGGEICGPSWNLSEEYPGLNSKELEADISAATAAMDKMNAVSPTIANALPSARNITLEEVESLGLLPILETLNGLRWKSSILLRNVYTYASCSASTDGTNEEAKRLSARVSELFAKHSQAAQPLELFLDQVPDEVVQAFLALTPETKENEFLIMHSRKTRDNALSLEEENMLSSYQVPGITSWGALYTDLSGTLKVTLQEPDGSTRTVGVAAAAGMLDSADETVRENAWRGIKNAWEPHTETCAAILNALTSWRIETYRRRNIEHYLDTPMHLNRMSRNSLSALFEAVDADADVGRRALKLQAAALGKDVMAPWDLLAPAPVGDASTATIYTFDEGIDVIANAVAEVDAEAGSFVRMMKEKRWIEASKGSNKRPGAYCTGFAKSRTPRVYLSDYNGGAPLLLTLAHELGHAYHNWVMRDMPLAETSYPMNLAETASIFFETVVANSLMKRAESVEEKFAISWTNANSAATFLLNIPARFKFESDVNEERQARGKLSAGDLDALMVEAWKAYYKDTLSHMDEVGIFYATKLHFHISGLSFYNFPYTFGWLFSLGVFAQRDSFGAGSFALMYRQLLRDTGRMTAEEVVEKHMGGKIFEAGFWRGAIALVRAQMDEFEALGKQLGYCKTV